MKVIDYFSKLELNSKCDWEIFGELGIEFNELKYRKGETIIDIGDDVDSFYYLKQGAVRLYLSNNQSELMFYSLSAGTSFAEPAFFCGLPSKIRVVAVKDSIVLSFPKNLVLDYFYKQNAFIKLLIDALSRKIYLITTMYENISNSSSELKIAKVLYLLSSKNNNSKMVVNITHEELASILGMHRVTVTRNLSKLKKNGLITINRNSIVINDANKLVSYF